MWPHPSLGPTVRQEGTHLRAPRQMLQSVQRTRQGNSRCVLSWSGLGSVKALAQAGTIAAPHLLVGGKGYMVGMLDLRLVSSINISALTDTSSTAPLVNPFVKLWSPVFPYDISKHHDPDMAEQYHNTAAPFHAYGKSVRNYKGKPAMIHGSFSSLSISGLHVSKDGQRMVANVQGDQLFTFPLHSPAACTGIQALLGGHVNYGTFLKDVSFFGPQDEYVACGSDSGHMWVWDSRPTRRPKLIGGARDSYTCRLVNVLRADRRTCNGVAPHPYAPLLVSYGIDDDAKVWTYRTPEDSEEPAADDFNMLCRQDSPRDASSFDRISLALPD
ncbi:hypothetical protein EON65_13215, partial [archaeon]